MIGYNPTIITDGLVLCLDAANPRSYTSGSTTWSDLSGNGNNATLVNGPAFNTGSLGSIQFDAVNDSVIASMPPNFSYENGITISVWHYNGGSIAYRGLINNGGYPDDRLGGFDLRYGRENYFGGSNNGTFLFLYITNLYGQYNYSLLARLYANANEWHQYVGTYDNNTIKMYKDGDLFTSETHPAGGQIKNLTNYITIGSSGGREYLDGKLSQTFIYNRALTPDEIKQNFNATRGRFGI